MARILLTGGSGFVASHLLRQALAAGHEVCATVRSAERERVLRDALAAANTPRLEALSFAHVDLLHDAGWEQAVDGCEFVLHTASPFPKEAPSHEDELIKPAVEGTLRALRFATSAKVKRVVVTSSVAAIAWGAHDPALPFTEADWTDAASDAVRPYAKSKTLAERAAWSFVEQTPGAPELATVNPSFVLGPKTGTTDSTSLDLVAQVLAGEVGAAQRKFAFVDVRDVAALHLRAMTVPAAAGQRFLAGGVSDLTLPELALAIKDTLGDAAVPLSREALAELNRPRATLSPFRLSNERAQNVLGWEPIPFAQTLRDTVQSLG